MFYRLVLANFLFSLRDINLTLGLLPPRRHVVWRASVGVKSSRSGLKSECADIFHQSFLWLLRHTHGLQRGRNSCLWLQSLSVLSSFGVVLMSYRVNFQVVRSALQYSPYKVLRHNIDIKVIEVCARVIARGSCITWTTLVQVRGVALCSGTNIHRTRYYTRACFDHFYVYVIA